MKQKGFSLVELAIVLVIIGLITGGILTGQDLIRASELNSLHADVNKYKTASNTFRIKYNGLPGDITNAYQYWGVAQGCANTNSSASNGCNGNADGRVQWAYEGVRAWQMLSWAGLIPGSWATTTPVTVVTPVTDTPEMRIKGVGISFVYFAAFTNTVREGHTHFSLGRLTATNYTLNPFLTPTEAASVDSKYDDGKSDTGNIFAVAWTNCTTGTYPNMVFTLTNTTESCNLAYQLD